MDSLLWVLLACSTTAPVEATPEPQAAVPEAPAPLPAARLERVVAVGDLHADLDQALAVLQMAGVVDASGQWSGGTDTLVQTGDTTDRGPDSKEVIQLMARLEEQAEAAGGRVVALLGNHEVMNLVGDWRYVSEGDLADYGGSVEVRQEAFGPQGEEGTWLRKHGVVAVVDRVAYAHGGITAEWARKGVDAINATPYTQLGTDSPIWYRGFITDPEPTICRALEDSLVELSADRMVVGHTTQKSGRILSRCQGRILGIDTGISSHYGGNLAALELRSGDAWALYAAGPEDLPDP